MAGALRVAVVGLGEAGATLHLPALRSVPSATLVGLCEADESRRQEAAGRWQVPTFSDAEALLRELEPDVLIIATPPDTHRGLCLAAAAHGAHVLCEKPFVTSAAEGDEVLAAAQRAERLVAVNHEFREMPIFRALIDAARSGVEGDLLFAHAWQSTDMPPWREGGWRGALKRRTLFEAGVHHLDFLMALFGETPRSVVASTSSAGLDEADRDAMVVATLEFSRGRLGLLSMNRTARGAPQYFEARADFSGATYRASFGGRARVSAGLYRSTQPHFRLEIGRSGLAWREIGSVRRVVARNPSLPNVDATRRVMAASFDAFRRRVAPASSGAVARDVIAVVDACYASAAVGARVPIAAPKAPDTER